MVVLSLSIEPASPDPPCCSLQHQALQGVQRLLAAFCGIEPLPLSRFHRHIQQGEQGRNGRDQSFIECCELISDTLAQRPSVVSGLQLKVRPEKLGNGEESRRLTVRDGTRL